MNEYECVQRLVTVFTWLSYVISTLHRVKCLTRPALGAIKRKADMLASNTSVPQMKLFIDITSKRETRKQAWVWHVR